MKLRLLAPLLGILCMGSHALADTGAGYVGIYADSLSAIPCATVMPGSGATLHVVATVAGPAIAGIHGAEFRIEVSNPVGWQLSYSPPAGALTLGNVLDTDPLSGSEGSGMSIVFTSCQNTVPTRVGGDVLQRVRLGTISVFNVYGGPTHLSVKAHGQPPNPNTTCPLFILCDSAMSPVCMSPAGEPPCALIGDPEPEASKLATDDPTVFLMGLNIPTAPPQDPPRAPPESTFVDFLTLATGNELWVMGEQVIGPVVECVFDGEQLFIAGIAVQRIPILEPTDADLEAMWGHVPIVAAYRAAGMTFREAYDAWGQEMDTLQPQACAAYQDGGDAALIEVLESSPLVESLVEVENGFALVKHHGVNTNQMISCRNPSRTERLTKAASARRKIDAIRPFVGQSNANCLVILEWGTVARLGGADADAARAQLNYVRQTGGIEGLPAGPLSPNDDSIQAIVRTGKGVEGE